MKTSRTTAGNCGGKVVHGVVLASLLLGLLAGCAPLIPRLETDESVSCSRPTGNAIPYDCINQARAELIKLQTSAGTYNRVIGYTAVAGGTYAGYQASRAKPNTALLKHAAIGVAALMGFDSIVDADKQITTLDGGILALDCVRYAADAIEMDHANQPLAPVDAAAMKNVVRSTLAGPAVPAAGLGAIDALVDAKVGHVSSVNTDWANAAQSARNNAPLRVYHAVLSIRQEVRRQLMLGSVDIKGLYKAQQQAVSKLIGELATTGAQQTKLVESMETVIGAPLPMEKASTAAKDVYEQCIGEISDG